MLPDPAIPKPPGTPPHPVRATDPLRAELAAAAAGLVADSGLDYASAKRKALRLHFQGSPPPRGCQPDNHEIDAALAEHLALFDAAHPTRVLRRRQAALTLMHQLADYAPYLTGAVWKGIVAEHAPIHLQVFYDDSKAILIELINQGCELEATEMPSLQGEAGRPPVEALALVWHNEPVVISLHPSQALRGALRGLPAERGDTGSVARLVAEHHHVPPT